MCENVRGMRCPDTDDDDEETHQSDMEVASVFSRSKDLYFSTKILHFAYLQCTCHGAYKLHVAFKVYRLIV